MYGTFGVSCWGSMFYVESEELVTNYGEMGGGASKQEGAYGVLAVINDQSLTLNLSESSTIDLQWSFCRS